MTGRPTRAGSINPMQGCIFKRAEHSSIFSFSRLATVSPNLDFPYLRISIREATAFCLQITSAMADSPLHVRSPHCLQHSLLYLPSQSDIQSLLTCCLSPPIKNYQQSIFRNFHQNRTNTPIIRQQPVHQSLPSIFQEEMRRAEREKPTPILNRRRLSVANGRA